jgi:uroporphyrinogen-III synthase
VETERAFLAATGGGCRAPIGALATVSGGRITLTAGTGGREPIEEAAEERGPVVAWGEVEGPVEEGARLATRLADQLAERRAGLLRTRRPLPASPRVLVTRPTAQAGPLVAALEALGFSPAVIPTIEIRPVDPSGELDAALEAFAALLRTEGSAGVTVTSANGARAVLEATERLGLDLSAARWAAVGDGTAAALARRGVAAAFVPSVPDADHLAAELPLPAGATALLPQADLADGRLSRSLEARGARVTAVTAYRTVAGPEASRKTLREWFADGPPEAIVFTSGSTVGGLLALVDVDHRAAVRAATACCIGERTAAVARAEGFARVLASPSPAPASVAEVVAEALLLAAEVAR